MKFLANAASSRLTSFAGDQGSITFNWLSQVQAQANALPAGSAGTGLFTLLHWNGPTGTDNLGLLDKLAIKSLSTLLQQGNALGNIGLSPAQQATVNAMIANPLVVPANRFTSFPATFQQQLVTLYVFNRIGTVNLTYPSSTGNQYAVSHLLEYNLTDISFDIQINNTPIIDTLDFTNSGVNLVVDLPNVSGSAAFSANATSEYWGAVAAVAFGCIFSLGAACTLSPILISIGILVDISAGNIGVSLSDFVLNADITMVPNASNVLEPQVNLTLTASVSTSYTPNVDLGVNNLLGDIATFVANNTNIIIDALQSQLQQQLNDYLQNDLKLTFPPQFGPVTLTGLGTPFTDFIADTSGYVEQNLNAGSLGIIDPYVTQIDSVVQPNIVELRTQFKTQFTDPETVMQTPAVNGAAFAWSQVDFTSVARYYSGTVLSQNFINYYVYTLWRDGSFNFDFTIAQTKTLYEQVVTAFGGVGVPPYSMAMKAHIWPSVPPRTLFTPSQAASGGSYAETIFDDVRLCFELNDVSMIEFSFAAQTFTEIGFGAFDSSIGQLNLLKVSNRAFDIYFNQAVNIIDSEAQYFKVPVMQPSINFNYGPLSSCQTMFATALKLVLAFRNTTFIPHGTGDPAYIQRYPLGTNNAFGPQNSGNPLVALFQLVPFRGNLYVSQGLSGLATGALQGTNQLDIATMTSVTAQLILLV